MNKMTNWPTPAEIEAQQSPFDPNGTYPFEYKIVIVEQIAENEFEEQLRTYVISKPLDEQNISVPRAFSKEIGRRFRFAQDGETADLHVMNEASPTPVGLILMQENA